MENCQIKITNKKDINMFISKLLKEIKAPYCICLIGDLGVGKTYFSKQLIKKLCGNKVTVTSPTFSILNIYNKTNKNINTATEVWHLDLYRIENEEEILELGLEEAFQNNIVIIEWANRLSSLYPKNAITIQLSFTNNNTRLLKLTN